MTLSNIFEAPNSEAQIDSMRILVEQAFYKKRYDKVIEYGEVALNLSEEINYYKKYFSISSYLGAAYMNVEDTTRAKVTFSRSVAKANEIDNTVGKMVSQIDVANYYALQKTVSAKTKAVEMYVETIPLADSLNDTDSILILYLNSTELLIDTGKIDEAKKFAKITSQYITDSTFIGFQGSEKLNSAKIDFSDNKWNTALSKLSESECIFNQLQHNEGLIDTYKYKALSYLNLGNPTAAYYAMTTLDSLKSAKYESDRITAIETVTAKFKLADIKKELAQQQIVSEIKEREAKREITFLWIKIASGILLLFSTILMFSYFKRKKLVAHLTSKNKQYLEAKDKSEKLSKAKSTLFSNITHELRTPMYGIIGISKVLLEDEKLHEQKTNIKSLKFSADYLLSLINNILHFNMLDRSGPILEEAKSSIFDIRELVHNVVESSKYLSEDHPNMYHITIDDQVTKLVSGNRTKLSQVLMNLVGNATKFTNDGNIFITVNNQAIDQSTVELLFEIRDDGIGISDEKQKIIFNEFAQIGEGENFMGTGLGLPIVKRLLEEEKNSLSLESEENKGTRVSFKMHFSVSLQEHTVRTRQSYKALKGKRILIVDDNKINLLVTNQFVQRYGATGVTVNNGEEAIKLQAAQNFDLILMDINMPGMDGFETTAEIRKTNTSIPIIALTAVEKEKVIGQNTFYMMDDIIIKPYNEEQFIVTLQNHLKEEYNTITS